jgi:hypothetical protein
MIRADGLVKGNRHIRAKECKARANKFIYGRKEPRRQRAGLEANSGSEMVAAGSWLWVDDQREQTPNNLTPVMAANKVRQFVYGEKAKVQALAVAKANRHIKAKECHARAKKYIYGRKEAQRLSAGLEANRYIEKATACISLWVEEELDDRPNHGTTAITRMLSMCVFVLITTALFFAYRSNRLQLYMCM